jgi:hypothetical protein
MEMYKDTYNNTWLRKEGFLIETPDYMYPDAGTGDAFNGGSSTYYSLLSYFGKFSYDYDNRYLFLQQCVMMALQDSGKTTVSEHSQHFRLVGESTRKILRKNGFRFSQI